MPLVTDRLPLPVSLIEIVSGVNRESNRLWRMV
jgi:hypothetical protein